MSAEVAALPPHCTGGPNTYSGAGGPDGVLQEILIGLYMEVFQLFGDPCRGP
jgi:hypothetical protein